MRSNYGAYLVMLVIAMNPITKCQNDVSSSVQGGANESAPTLSFAETTTVKVRDPSGPKRQMRAENETTTEDSNSTSAQNFTASSAAPSPRSHCYQCRSDTDEGCDGDEISHEHLKPCNVEDVRSWHDIELPDNARKSRQMFCRKIVQYLKFINNTPRTIIARECTVFHEDKEQCYKDITQAFTLTICECKEEGCNTSPSTKRISRFLLAVAVSLIFFPYFPP